MKNADEILFDARGWQQSIKIAEARLTSSWMATQLDKLTMGNVLSGPIIPLEKDGTELKK